MSLGHRKHGKKVRKVRPGVGADAPKQIRSQPIFCPPTPHSLFPGGSWDSLFLTTLDSKKRKGKPLVIFKKETHKSLHRFQKGPRILHLGDWGRIALSSRPALAA